jgi:ActR/RegA family two-component response regulator
MEIQRTEQLAADYSPSRRRERPDSDTFIGAARPRDVQAAAFAAVPHFAPIRYTSPVEPLGRILLVEDDAAVAQAIRLALRAIAEVDVFAAPDRLPVPLRLDGYDAALLDMNFGTGERDGQAGLDVIDALRGADPTLAIVMLTVFGGVALAVEALKRGASDFLLKPWRNDRLVEAMRAAAALTATQRAGAAMSLEAIERHAIARALERNEGNISKAAAALGLTRPALYRRMEKHGL